MPAVDAPRVRRSFARLNKIHDLPNLLDIQRRSFEWLTDPENGGLRETIDDISPIEDYTGNLAVDFGEFTFDEPVAGLAAFAVDALAGARASTRQAAPRATGARRAAEPRQEQGTLCPGGTWRDRRPPATLPRSADSRSRPIASVPRHIRGGRGRGP